MNASKAVVAAITTSICSCCFAQTPDDRCVVKHPHFGNGETVTATMMVINDGEPCEMQIRFGGNPATSLKILAKPGNGTLVGARFKVSYTPNPGFMGNDSFDVEWFGLGFGPNSPPEQRVRVREDGLTRYRVDESRPVDDAQHRLPQCLRAR